MTHGHSENEKTGKRGPSKPYAPAPGLTLHSSPGLRDTKCFLGPHLPSQPGGKMVETG